MGSDPITPVRRATPTGAPHAASTGGDPDTPDTTGLLLAASRAGGAGAFDRLPARVYDELARIAAG